jgi:hypothetical protein
MELTKIRMNTEGSKKKIFQNFFGEVKCCIEPPMTACDFAIQ